MGSFKAVIRLIKERLEVLSLRRGISALCILTAVTMFSFAAPFALSFSYAETIVDGQETSQNVVQSGEAEGAGNETVYELEFDDGEGDENDDTTQNADNVDESTDAAKKFPWLNEL